MRRAAVGAVVGLAAVFVAAPAKELVPVPGAKAAAPTPANPAEVRGFVAQLGSPDFRAREAAGRQLLALGDRAAAQLREAARTADDPEVARRLQVLLAAVDRDRLTTARRVTLKVENKAPRAVIAELEKQSGYALQYGGGDDGPRVTLDLADVPFWEALDAVCNAAGLQANPNGNDGGLHVYPSNTYSPFASYSGPFKVQPTQISTSRSVPLAGLPRAGGGGGASEFLNLQLNVHSEPKAPLVSVGQPRLLRAVDDTGTSLVPPDVTTQTSRYYSSYGGYYRSYYQTVTLNLYRPGRSAGAIREVRGTVPVAVLSETRPDVAVPDLLAAKKQRYQGRTVDVDLKAADFAAGTLTVELTVSRRNADPNDYNWGHSVAGRLAVTDADGNPYTFNGVTSQTTGPAATTMTAQFRAPINKKLGKPARLEYVEWVTVTTDVPFTFRDVPLP